MLVCCVRFAYFLLCCLVYVSVLLCALCSRVLVDRQSLEEDLENRQEMAKGLDVSGTYIKYFGRKRDVVAIQGQLFDAKLRWKRLRVRTHEKGRHLQQAYRKSKQVVKLQLRSYSVLPFVFI